MFAKAMQSSPVDNKLQGTKEKTEKEVSQEKTKKEVSEATRNYNKGHAKGRNTGRRKGIEECHEALKKAGKADLCSLLPKIPVVVSSTKDPVKLKEQIMKVEALLAKKKAAYAQSVKEKVNESL